MGLAGMRYICFKKKLILKVDRLKNEVSKKGGKVFDSKKMSTSEIVDKLFELTQELFLF